MPKTHARGLHECNKGILQCGILQLLLESAQSSLGQKEIWHTLWSAMGNSGLREHSSLSMSAIRRPSEHPRANSAWLSLATRGPLGREGSTSDQMMSNMDFVGVQVFFSLTRHAFIFGVRSTNLGSELPKRGRCITPSVLIVSSIKPFGSKEYISPRADKVSRVSGWTIVSIIFCFVAANCGRASDRSTSARCKRSVILSGPSADQR